MKKFVPDLCFHQLFEIVAAENPEKIAVYYEDGQSNIHSLTYKEVNSRANALANELLTKFKKYNDAKIVAVCLDRTPYYLISLLAIWKAGLIYFPINPSVNSDQIVKRIKDSTAKHFIFEKDKHIELQQRLVQAGAFIFVPNIQEQNQLEVAELENPVQPHTLTSDAYLICSSGTMGLTKLIMCNFEGLPSRINGILSHIQFESDSCVLGFSNYDFDSSLMDIMLALGTGSSIYIVSSKAQQDFCGELNATLQRAKRANIKIDYAALIPVVIDGIDQSKTDFKNIITMGDKCHWETIKSWIENGVNIYDGYGPTEACIAATMRKLTLQGLLGIVAAKNSTTLEGVFSDVIFALVNKIGNEYQIVTDYWSCAGEIVLGGKGIGYYWNNNELNNEKFITLPALGPGRFYLTGDLVKFEQGKFTYVGRNDRVIRQKGQWVPLDVFEESLTELSYLEVAVVISSERSIIAFVIPKQNIDFDQKKLREMQTVFKNFPVYIFQVSHLPKKINKNTPDYGILKNPDPSIKHKFLNFVDTREGHFISEDESKIAAICEEILIDPAAKALVPNNNIIQRTQSLQEVGADSIHFPILMNKIWNEFFSGSDHRNYSTTRFRKLLRNTDSIADINLALMRFKYNYLTKLTNGHFPAIYLISYRPFTEIEELKKSIVTMHLSHTVYLVSSSLNLTLNELTDDFADAIQSNQINPPYHLVFFESAMEQQQLLIGKLNPKDTAESNVCLAQLNNLRNLEENLITFEEKIFKEKMASLKKNQHLTAEQMIKKHRYQDHTNRVEQYLVKIDQFINEASQTILFIAGPAGIGKTDLVQQFVLKSSMNDRIFIYIDLQSNHSIQAQLTAMGFGLEQINRLKAMKIGFICDNYQPKLWQYTADIWQSNQLEQWTDVKLIVLSNYLQPIAANTSYLKLDFIASENVINYLQDPQIQEALTQLPLTPLIISLAHQHSAKTLSNVPIYLAKNIFKYLLNKHSHLAHLQFSDFLNFIRQFAEYFPEGIDLGMSLSYWGNKHAIDLIEKYRSLSENVFSELLTDILTQEQSTSAKLPEWLIVLSRNYQEVDETSNLNDLKLSGNTTTSEFLTHHRKTIINQIASKHTIFAFYPLAGSAETIYNDIAYALRLSHNFVTFSFSVSYIKDKYSDVFSIRTRARLLAQQICTEFPEDVYYLVGWSFGGLLAYAVAVELISLGKSVQVIYSIDSLPPHKIKDISLLELSKSVLNTIANVYTASGCDKIPQFISQKLATITEPEQLFTQVIEFLKAFETTHDQRTQEFIKKLWCVYINTMAEYDYSLDISKQLPNVLNVPFYSAIANENTDCQYGKVNVDEWQQYLTAYHSQNFPGNHFTLFKDELFEAIKDAIHASNRDRVIQTRAEAITCYLSRSIIESEHSIPNIELEVAAEIGNQAIKQKTTNILSRIYAPHFTKNIIIIRGTVGSGKSTLARTLFSIQLNAYQYFSTTNSQTSYRFKKKYLSSDHEFSISNHSCYFPIFIDPVTQPKSLKQHLVNQGFDSEMAEAILKEENLVIIIDAIDEMNSGIKIEEFISSIGKIQSARFIMTYRSPLNNELDAQFNNLKTQFEAYFTKRISYFFEDTQRNSNFIDLLTLQNLSRDQVELYLESSLSKSEFTNHNLETIERQHPILTDFLTNPLTLFLIAQTYPMLLETLSPNKEITTSNSLLYELYLKKLIRTYAMEKGYRQEDLTLEELFIDYCEKIALNISEEGSRNLNARQFFYDDSLTTLLKRSCPITVTNLSVKFIHISFLHYLLANLATKQLINKELSLFNQQKRIDNVPVLDFIFEMLLAYARKIQDRQEFNRVFGYLSACIIQRRSGAKDILPLFEKINEGYQLDLETIRCYALMLHENHQQDKAKKLFLELIDDTKHSLKKSDLYNILCNLGTTCQSNKDFDDAKFYFHQALELSYKLTPRDNQIGYLYNALGGFYYNPKEENPHRDVEESLKYLMLSIQEEQYIDIVKTWRFIGWGHFNLARIYSTHPDYLDATKARQHFTKFRECIEKKFYEKFKWPESYRKLDNEYEEIISKLEVLQQTVLFSSN